MLQAGRKVQSMLLHFAKQGVMSVPFQTCVEAWRELDSVETAACKAASKSSDLECTRQSVAAIPTPNKGRQAAAGQPTAIMQATQAAAATLDQGHLQDTFVVTTPPLAKPATEHHPSQQKAADPVLLQTSNTTGEIPALSPAEKHTEAEHVVATAVSTGQVAAGGAPKQADPVLPQTSNTTGEIRVRSPADLPQSQRHTETEHHVHVVATASSTGQGAAATGVQKQADPVLVQTTNTTGEMPARSPPDLQQSQKHTEAKHATAISTGQGAAATGVQQDADPVLPQTTATTGEIPARSPPDLQQSQKHAEAKHATAISTGQGAAATGVQQDADPVLPQTTATTGEIPARSPAKKHRD